ncbi:hypothetical protein GCM10009839_56270 [Catenulispora yoronensis]|uniref:Lipoprotein n=1 Tax=Catenulispora yoronensis TaxID=450799 RepID=A0ABP5GIT4_9ACTN
MTVRRSILATTAAGGLCLLLLAGCRSDASQSGSAPGPSPTDASGSVSSAVSRAQSAATSALSEISDGVTADGDVTAGAASVDADGHGTAQLTVKNTTGDVHDYTISVIFDGSDGGLADVVVVNVSKVAAHGESHATARSTRKLSGTLTVKVSAAVRH